MTDRPKTPWEAWKDHGLTLESWQLRVAVLAMNTWERSGAAEPVYEKWSQVFETVRGRVDWDTAYELDLAHGTALAQSMEYCALLGYCLGRTTPAGLEDFDTWLERALELMNTPKETPDVA